MVEETKEKNQQAWRGGPIVGSWKRPIMTSEVFNDSDPDGDIRDISSSSLILYMTDLRHSTAHTVS